MLRGIGEPLLRRRAPGLARLADGRAGGAADALAGEARRGSPDRHSSTDEGGCYLQVVPVRPATEVAPAGAVMLAVAKATTPPGAVAMAVERATLEGSVVAAATSVSKVFLLRLPGGRPRLQGTSGVAVGSFALF
jgi:hypothetical protein